MEPACLYSCKQHYTIHLVQLFTSRQSEDVSASRPLHVICDQCWPLWVITSGQAGTKQGGFHMRLHRSIHDDELSRFYSGC